MKEGALEVGEAFKNPLPSGLNRGISILDLILRIVAVLGTLGSAVAMATTHETLPFSTQFSLFRAEYDDLPTLSFFVIANSVVCAYLALSIPPSIFYITVEQQIAMLGLLTAAIVYLAHKGNASANWLETCQQFSNFCERISGSLIGSFGGIIMLIYC